MLELVALFFLCSHMGSLLRKKGRKPLLMQIAVVVCWIGAMFAAAFLYGIYLALRHGPDAAGSPGMIIYPVMLAAAVLAQLALFSIAHFLSNKAPPQLPPIPGSAVRYEVGA